MTERLSPLNILLERTDSKSWKEIMFQPLVKILPLLTPISLKKTHPLPHPRHPQHALHPHPVPESPCPPVPLHPSDNKLSPHPSDNKSKNLTPTATPSLTPMTPPTGTSLSTPMVPNSNPLSLFKPPNLPVQPNKPPLS